MRVRPDFSVLDPFEVLPRREFCVISLFQKRQFGPIHGLERRLASILESIPLDLVNVVPVQLDFEVVGNQGEQDLLDMKFFLRHDING